MALRGTKCPDCGRKVGHKPGCAKAAACPECGFTLGHDGSCPRAVNTEIERRVAEGEAAEKKRGRGRRRMTVDGAAADVVEDGVVQEELLGVDTQELLDTLATQVAIRERYAGERDRWSKKVKAADDGVDRIVKTLTERGNAKGAILERLDVLLPDRED